MRNTSLGIVLIVCSAAGLTLLGLAGLVRADQLYGRQNLVDRQLVWFLLALGAMAVTALTPYRLLRLWGIPVWLFSLLLLVVVLFMPALNGSRRWIPLGLFDLQASEPARLAFVMALASWLMHRDSQRRLPGLFVPGLLALVPMLLIMIEPDLDTALLFLPVLAAMLLAAGAQFRHLLGVAGLMFCSLPLLWLQMSAEQQSRIVSVVMQRDGGDAPTGDGYHLHQAKQVLALSGMQGSFWRDEPVLDDPAAYRLPAAGTDFIFTMIGERFGVSGCLLVLLLHGILIWQAVCTAVACQESWGRLAAVGLMTLMGVQVVLNTAMTVGLLPITGTALPLCSYGGSSLISTYAALGVLISIRRTASWEAAVPSFLKVESLQSAG
ncbi:MAG: FtsW/RodA/SpoVE family cell cycle protein [Planctomycetaceae bacterium]